ncbi:MAG: archease [Planctomycetota bacterium]|nr:archease [Planctomycetota bacterium]MDA1138313.1 archease [Planctomycetota bacterium]
MERYIELDHTADVGVSVFGKSLEELFEAASFALFDLQVDLSDVRAEAEFEIAVTGTDLENTIVRWLQRLIALMDIEDIVFSRFELLEVTEESARGKAWGEPLDISRHRVKGAIKAVTYHELEIKETSDGWEAQIIFDV